MIKNNDYACCISEIAVPIIIKPTIKVCCIPKHTFYTSSLVTFLGIGFVIIVVKVFVAKTMLIFTIHLNFQQIINFLVRTLIYI